jgi:hypothetical protein
MFLATIEDAPGDCAGMEILTAREAPEADIPAMVAYRQQVHVRVVDSQTGEDLPDASLSQPPWVWSTPWLIVFRLTGQDLPSTGDRP